MMIITGATYAGGSVSPEFNTQEFVVGVVFAVTSGTFSRGMAARQGSDQ